MADVWWRASQLIAQNLVAKKGTRVPNLGTFTLVEKKTDLGTQVRDDDEHACTRATQHDTTTHSRTTYKTNVMVLCACLLACSNYTHISSPSSLTVEKKHCSS